MSGALAGRRALITGASRGLGRAIARAMWAAGASLALVARSGADLAALATELMEGAAPGQTVATSATDLAEPEAVAALLATPGLLDGVDVLVNNAAIVGPIGPAWENDWRAWQRTLQVDLLTPVALCRACLPGMIERRRGAVVNLSGGGATGPRPAFSAYATAKTGLVRFSEVLAAEAAPFGVRVNCLAPGAMNTAMTEAVLRAGPALAGDAEHRRAREVAEAGGAAPERAAALCVFLASERAAGITGKLISAVWDPWETLPDRRDALGATDIYTLRRVVPRDRGEDW